MEKQEIRDRISELENEIETDQMELLNLRAKLYLLEQE